MAKQNDAAEKKAAKMVDVKLKRAHTHAGHQHQAGETITVSAADARWLIDHNIGTAGNEESK